MDGRAERVRCWFGGWGFALVATVRCHSLLADSLDTYLNGGTGSHVFGCLVGCFIVRLDELKLFRGG